MPNPRNIFLTGVLLTLASTYAFSASALDWGVEARVRFAGPFMGSQSEGLSTILYGTAEVAVGPIFAGGGYSLKFAAEGSAEGPVFFGGGAWTFFDGRANNTGSWQARWSGLLGNDRMVLECGSDCLSIWNALAITTAIDGTWWFSQAVGLELRLALSVLTPLSEHRVFDNQTAPSFAASALTTVGLAFDIY